MKILQKTISKFDQDYRHDPSHERAKKLGSEIFMQVAYLDKRTQLEAWEFVYSNTIQFGNEIISQIASGASKFISTTEQRKNLIEGLSGMSLVQKKLQSDSIFVESANHKIQAKQYLSSQPQFNQVKEIIEKFETAYNPKKLTSSVLVSQLGTSLGKEITSLAHELQVSAWEIVHEKFKHNFPGVLISLAQNASLYIDDSYQRQNLINGLSGMSLLQKQTVETHPKLKGTVEIIDMFIKHNDSGKSTAKDIDKFADALVKQIDPLEDNLQLVGWEMVYCAIKDFSGAFKDHLARSAAKKITTESHLRNIIDGVTGYSLMQKDSLVKNVLDKQLVAQKLNNDLDSDNIPSLDPKLKPMQEIMIQFFGDSQQVITDDKISALGKKLGKEIVSLSEPLQEKAWTLVYSEFKDFKSLFLQKLAKNASQYTIEASQRKHLINGISGVSSLEIKKIIKPSFVKN